MRTLAQWLLFWLASPLWLLLLLCAWIADLWEARRPARPANTCRHCRQPLPPSHQCNCE